MTLTHSDTLDTQLDAYDRRAARRGSRKTTAEVLGYTAAAGGLAFAGGDAIGGIMPFASTPVTASVGVGGNLNLGIDVDGVGNNDLFFFLGNHRTSTNTVFLRSTSGFAAVADGTTSSANALNLAPGFAVGPTPVAGAFADYNPWLLYSSGGSHAFGNFRNGTTGYIGFRFNGDTGSGGTQYGWMKVRIDTGDDFTKLTLLDGAYDDEGDPIVVGATGDGGGEVPVPATSLLTLLGLGALGVQRYRRRRDAGLARLAGEQAAA